MSANITYLTAARQMLRQYARNASSSAVFSTQDLDRAIFSTHNDFLRRTRLLKLSFTGALTTGTWKYSLDSSLTAVGWRPEMLKEATVGDPTTNLPLGTQADPLSRIDYDAIWKAHGLREISGAPVDIGFDSWGSFAVYPTPDQDYNLNLYYWLFETTWTFGQTIMPTATAVLTGDAVSSLIITNGGGEFGGTAPTISFSGGGGSSAAATAVLDAYGNFVASATVTGGGSGYTSAPTVAFAGSAANASADIALNMPFDLSEDALRTGGVARLIATTPENQVFIAALKDEYEKFVARNRAAGSLGSASADKSPAWTLRP